MHFTRTSGISSSSNGLFSVNSAGYLTATSGTIGGLTLSENSISASNGKFSVNSAGKLTAEDADISGVLTATSGTIGELTIAESGKEKVRRIRRTFPNIHKLAPALTY